MEKLTSGLIKSRINLLLKNSTYPQVIDFDQELDHFFLPNIKNYEKCISNDDPNAYGGLDTRALLTSYLDYYQVLNDLPVGECLIDLGAGYSRGTFISEFLGLSKCLSLEFVSERVNFSIDALAQHGGDTDLIQKRDLENEDIEKAYAYYLYFPKGDGLDEILKKLFFHAQTSPLYIYACESHGDLLIYLDSFKHLTLIREFRNSLPRHGQGIKKYRVGQGDIKISWKQDLSSWFLFNKKSQMFVVIDYYHPILKKPVEWLLDLGHLELIHYQDKLYFKDLHGRIIDIGGSEPIKRICGKPRDINLLISSFSSKNIRKILFDDRYLLEMNTGEIKYLH